MLKSCFSFGFCVHAEIVSCSRFGLAADAGELDKERPYDDVIVEPDASDEDDEPDRLSRYFKL